VATVCTFPSRSPWTVKIPEAVTQSADPREGEPDFRFVMVNERNRRLQQQPHLSDACPLKCKENMRVASCIAFVILALTSFAQTIEQPKSHSPRMIWEPPDWNFPQNVKASVQKEMLSSFRVSSYEIVLEQTAMKDAQQHLGGQIGSRGDAGGALEWLCFHGTNEMGRWVLWLESSEINGGLVGSFQWQQLPKSDVLDPRCQALRRADSMITLPLSRFTLGATQSQVLKSLGSPTAKDSERLIYLHEHDVTTKAVRDDPFISSNIVIVRLRNGVVWAIQASKTTSD
jgi:hypothetical protein